MQRFDLDMLRRDSGTLLSATADFRSHGDVDDLAYAASANRAYIAAGAADEGERIVLHQGPGRLLDQAAEAIIDRSMPTRVGGTPLGLILLWKTAGCDPDNLNVPCPGESGSDSELLSQYLCQPAEDETLGVTAHLRILVGDQLRVVEVSAAGQSELAAVDLNPLHRIVAVRAAHVDGDVLVWWNPTAELEFPDRPIARVHTLLNSAGRPGLIAGPDGRFLRAVFEYRTEHVSNPVSLRTAGEPLLDLVPVRLLLSADESRPPMQTGVQVAHFDDTLLPERQARESRVFLRDARVALRPGHRYRATAWLRTVDDERVVVSSKAFDLDGDAEDTALRDADGDLVLPPGDDLPEGETRSSVDLLQWCGLIPQEPLRTSAEPARTSGVDAMDTTVRGVQRSSLAPRLFDLEFIVTLEEKATLTAFYRQTQGRVLPFLWRHPWTGELIVVRFAGPPKFQGLQADKLQASCSFIEEPRPIGTAAETPETPGESESESGGEPPTCTPIAAGVPMYEDPSDSFDLERPMFRGADLRLPDTLQVEFGTFTKDAGHSFVGPLTRAIAALSGTWDLAYLTAHVPAVTTSRHWHHLRVTGAIGAPIWDASFLPAEVTRRFWQETRTYMGDDDAPHTMTVRVVAEDGDEGARGTLLNVYAFTDETGAFNDGDTVGGVAFYMDDPAVWDSSVGLWGAKRCHPQLLVCASVPTTMEAPAGFAAHEPGTYAFAITSPYCFRVTVGTPWSAGGSPVVDDALDNSVYGTQVDNYDQRTCTLGGGCPTSEFFDWVVVENGNADALTALVPALPGWDDPAGGLAVEAGTSVRCLVCDPGQDDDAITCCAGHPGAARTGTAECWKTSDAPAATHDCCYGANARLTVQLRQACIYTVGPDSYYGKFFVSDLDRMTPRVIRYLDDSASTDGRRFEWFLSKPDPLYCGTGSFDLRDTFDDFQDGVLLNFGTGGGLPYSGIWTETGGTLRNDGPWGPGALAYAILRTGPHANMDDIHELIAGATMRVAAKPYGILLRVTGHDQSDDDGYLGEYDPTDQYGRVWRVDSGALTLLGEVALSPEQIPEAGDVIAVQTSTGQIKLFIGADEDFDNPVLTVEDDDCTHPSGYVGLGTTVQLQGAQYDNFFVVVFPPMLEVIARLGQGGWETVCPERLMPGWALTYVGDPEGCNDEDGISKVLFPSEINELESGHAIAPAPDYTIDPDYDPCFGDENQLLDGFVAMEVRVEDDDEDTCTGGSDDEACDGADVWVIPCTDVP